MSGEQQADVRTSVGVDKVVVHELSRGGVAHHDAGAKAQRQRHGHDGGEGESAARDRWTEGRRARGATRGVCDAGDRAGEVRGAARRRDHVANETIPAARNRLNHTGVGTQRAADLANAEIDVLVVLDDAIGPQARTNLLARHQLSGVLYQQQEELRGLRLQRAALDSTAEDAAPGIEHVRSESDEGRHETIIR